MAIPVALQNFKAAGIYRLVYDKSTVLNEDTNVLRLIVGYSEKGAFNTPVYVTSVSEFKEIFGGISKKLEKRGCYFHRTAIQALQNYPCLVLNLKKFDGETVEGLTISTDAESDTNLIDKINYYVEDIYDTTRFWTLEADKLSTSNVLKNGNVRKNYLNTTRYINIANTSSNENTSTIFIRKANGSKVSGYDITVSDWYTDTDEIPDFLANKLQSEISDYFAEVYVFKGEFSVAQIQATESLQTYFDVVNGELQLKPYVLNAYGEAVDTLDELYNCDVANGIAHYVGSLIPYFETKMGAYMALDILFNSDVDIHHLMMSFNTDLLYEDDPINIDLSLSNNNTKIKEIISGGFTTTNCLGNLNSPINMARVSLKYNDKIEDLSFVTNETIENAVYDASISYFNPLTINKTTGGDPDVMKMTPIVYLNTDYISPIAKNGYMYLDESCYIPIATYDRRFEIYTDCSSNYKLCDASYYNWTASYIKSGDSHYLSYVGITNPSLMPVCYHGGLTTISPSLSPFYTYSYTYTDKSDSKKSYVSYELTASFANISHNEIINKGNCVNKNDCIISGTQYIALTDKNSYNICYYMNSSEETIVAYYKDYSSVNDVKRPLSYNGLKGVNYHYIPKETAPYYNTATSIKFDKDESTKYSYTTFDDYFINLVNVGDVFVGNDKEFSNVVEKDGNVVYFSCEPFVDKIYDGTTNLGVFLYKMGTSFNKEIGVMKPYALHGYEYKNGKPASTSMSDKLKWQKLQLSALTEYKGIRTALLNKAEVDYRYIVDSWESFVDNELKSTLSLLAKDKESALLIANFPSVKTFMKCDYNNYTNSNGLFDVQYIVDGYNSHKAHSYKFSLPSETNGASFAAFYTPLRFSDGSVDSIYPSAGLVSNLFIEKYYSRFPYDIVAGPNYGIINATNLVGPDYNYSKDELNIIEPFGVNCMVYRPSFGTFINANQTAKQSPKTALSSVNVRELVIYIQDEIENILQSYQWEFNNATVRQKIKDRADLVCETAMKNGGIYAYRNVMDESNNTDEIIDNEMSIIDTHIEPGRGMGKMVQRLTLYRTGKMTATIDGE